MTRPAPVLLVTGPGGSGKSSLAAALAVELGWDHVSEDDHWVRHGWTGHRSAAQEDAVQAEVVAEADRRRAAGRGVVIDLILYRAPPSPVTAYEARLGERGIPVRTVVLRPTVDEIVRRMTGRGRESDLADLATRRAQAEWQVLCADAAAVDADWRIDTTHLTVDETVARVVALLRR